jgi:DNA excision repair protein ERCC-2
LSAINKILLEMRKACQAAGHAALVEYALPEELLKAVREFSQKAEDWLALNQPAEYRQALLEFYFLCSSYLRTAEYFDAFYVSYFERQGQGDLKAKLFCLDPAPMLAGPLARSQATVFFSATLLPMDYFTQAADRRCGPSPAHLPIPLPGRELQPAGAQRHRHPLCPARRFLRCHCRGD